MSSVRGWGQDTVTRNQRGSEGRTEGAVLGIRSPGTNGVPKEEPMVRFSGYGHQEPTGFQGEEGMMYLSYKQRQELQ